MLEEFDKLLTVSTSVSCWKKPKDQPVGQSHEIIEIGVALVNIRELEVEKWESIIVKPKKSKVSEFCTNLTSITQTQVDKGITFEEACNKLKFDFFAKERPWAAWGSFEKKIIMRQCESRKVQFPMSGTFVNLQYLFSIFRGLEKNLELDKAISKLNIPLVKRTPRGMNEAINIADLFVAMSKKMRVMPEKKSIVAI